MLAFSEFARLAQQGNYVPVTLTLTADLETPVSILSRLKDDEDVFLLESVEAGERFGRNSFIGLNPRARFSVEDGRAFMEDADGRRELPEAATNEGAFMALRSLTEGLRPAAPADLPSFTGGAVGALGWEMCGDFEPKTGYKPHGLTAAFMVAEDMIIFDNFRHTMTISAGVRIDEFPRSRFGFRRGRGPRGSSAGENPQAARSFKAPGSASGCSTRSQGQYDRTRFLRYGRKGQRLDP